MLLDQVEDVPPVAVDRESIAWSGRPRRGLPHWRWLPIPGPIVALSAAGGRSIAIE